MVSKLWGIMCYDIVVGHVTRGVVIWWLVNGKSRVKNEGNKNQSPKQTNCIRIINISLNCDEAQTKSC